MRSPQTERQDKRRPESNWIVQALVTARINQIMPSALTVFSTFLVLIRAGIVDRNRLDFGVIALALAIGLGISIVSFTLGIRFTIRTFAIGVALLFSRSMREERDKHWWIRLADRLGAALMRLAFLPEWFSEMRNTGSSQPPDFPSFPRRWYERNEGQGSNEP